MNPKNPVAVLSSYWPNTVTWICHEFNPKVISYSKGEFELEDGRTLIIINSIEKAAGRYFSEYIKAPDYNTLEEYVKGRIR
jgi:hypothetical protein